MKKIIYIVALITGLYSCNNNPLEEFSSSPDREIPNDKVTIRFEPALAGNYHYDNGMVPMTRAGYDKVKTCLYNLYKAVIIKYIDQKWIVDTVLQGKIKSNATKNYIFITDTPTLPPIETELRPGIYKIGLFVNFSGVKWNEQLKKGYIVSSREELLPTSTDLPAAYTVAFSKGGGFPNAPEGSLVIDLELFAGMASFTVTKNNDLHTPGHPGNISIPLQRQVSRYRFLLQPREKQEEDKDPDFISTPYWFNGNLVCLNGQRFCDGINILGGPYYAEGPGCTSMPFHCSTVGNYFFSEEDQRLYFMAMNSWDDTPANVGRSTNFAPFILTDNTKTEGINCEIRDIYMSGPSGEPGYDCKENVDFTLKPNSIIEKVYKVKMPIEYNSATNQFTMIHVPTTEYLFPSFYELNAVQTIIENN